MISLGALVLLSRAPFINKNEAMKKINVFLAVASAMMMTMGCNSTDEVTEIEKKQQPLTVSVEQLQDEPTTRSAIDANGNTLYWQTGDVINVYDEILTTYDEYSFSPSDRAFVTKADNSYIDGTISYALYPGNLVDYAGWTSSGIRAVMSLATPIIAGDSKEDKTTVAGKTLYTSNLPMWGTANGTFGQVYVSLKYLTAVLKLNLENVVGNATFIKVTSSKPLSGGFEAVIASSTKVMNPDAVLKKGAESLATKNYVVVDLRGVTSAKTTVYVPIIVDTYDDLTVSYTNKQVDAKKTLSSTSIKGTDGTEWTVIKTYPEGKQMKRNTAYSVSKSFTGSESADNSDALAGIWAQFHQGTGTSWYIGAKLESNGDAYYTEWDTKNSPSWGKTPGKWKTSGTKLSLYDPKGNLVYASKFALSSDGKTLTLEGDQTGGQFSSLKGDFKKQS